MQLDRWIFVSSNRMRFSVIGAVVNAVGGAEVVAVVGAEAVQTVLSGAKAVWQECQLVVTLRIVLSEPVAQFR
jgi:hypothetical protein